MRGRKAQGPLDVGGLSLDKRSHGLLVEEIVTSGGGVSVPFGVVRLKPAAFCAAVRMVEETISYRKGRHSRSRRTGG